MEKKTYYMILGVSRGETSGGIRAAYRDRARQLHPDVAGEGATRAFQELNEAYGVLSDPSRRRAYNAQIALEAPSSLPCPWTRTMRARLRPRRAGRPVPATPAQCRPRRTCRAARERRHRSPDSRPARAKWRAAASAP